MKIKGTKGDDVLVGTNDADIIKGRKGADVLIGTGGADKLKGGKGADTFIVNGDDRILDFKQGVDHIVLDVDLNDTVFFQNETLYLSSVSDGDVGEYGVGPIVTIDGLQSILTGDIL